VRAARRSRAGLWLLGGRFSAADTHPRADSPERHSRTGESERNACEFEQSPVAEPARTIGDRDWLVQQPERRR